MVAGSNIGFKDYFTDELVGMLEHLYYYALQLTEDREDALDLVQETSYKALKNRKRLHDEEHIRAWLYTILKNTYINYLRSSHFKQIVLDTDELNSYVDRQEGLPGQVPDEILMKPGPLNENEWKIMKKHPEIGGQIVGHIDFLQNALPIIVYHHEHYDGTGYPEGLKGNEIPVLARIFSIVDAFDAQTNKRPYNVVKSTQTALDSLRTQKGKLFDPQVVDEFTAMIREHQEPLPQEENTQDTAAPQPTVNQKLERPVHKPSSVQVPLRAGLP